MLAGGQGFEPQLTDPKSVVLPLDDPPSTSPTRLHRARFPALWCRDPDLNWGHQHFQCCALPTELSRQKSRPDGRPLESGRRDSNSRPSPWQGDVLPLNYARMVELTIFLPYIHTNWSPWRVDPVGFEPTIFSLQRRRLPARPRARFALGADERTRTSTPYRVIDPKSIASAIPPRRPSATPSCGHQRLHSITASACVRKFRADSYPRFCQALLSDVWSSIAPLLSSISATIAQSHKQSPAVCSLPGITQLHSHRCDEITPGHSHAPA